MKKFKLFSLIVILMICLTSCSFIEYTEGDATDNTASEELKSQYQDALLDFSTLDEYRSLQKQEYIDLVVETRGLLEEAQSEEELEAVYKQFFENVKKIKKALEAAKAEAEERLNGVNPEEYYEWDRSWISELTEYYRGLIADAGEDTEVDELLTAFEVALYQTKTIAETEAEELQNAKDYAVYIIYNWVDKTAYRWAEQGSIEALQSSYSGKISEAQEISAVVALREECCALLQELPTDRYYSNLEKNQLIEESYNEFIAIIEGLPFADELREELMQSASECKESMDTLEDSEAVARSASLFKEKIYKESCLNGNTEVFEIYKNLAAGNLYYYEDADLYRSEQKTELSEIAGKYYDAVLEAEDAEAVTAVLDSAYGEMDALPTNEQLWAQEDAQFLEDLENLYGHSILDMPESLTVANSYEELVQIMDYYAFYQKDSSSFVRNCFRVKCTFNTLSPEDLRNEVYWMCELCHVALSVVAYYDVNPEYIVFEYTAYNIASRSNTENYTYLGKYNETVSINDQTYTKRSEDFDDFAYYQNTKSVRVWNSQQLWYALEHNYVPDCEPGSSAEAVLNKAKEVLREIVSDEMSDIEKIKAIFTWIGLNCEYDDNYENMPKAEDIENYPFAHFADLKAAYPEGVLFDHLAICSGYAKTYLIMLKIEGIDAVRSIGTHFVANTLVRTYHEYVYINMDGYWYFSDVERAPHRRNNRLTSLIFLMLSPYKETPNTTQVVYPNLNFATSRYEPIYESLSYDGLAIDDLGIIERFAEKGSSGDCCSLIVPIDQISYAEALAQQYGLGTLVDFWYSDSSYQELIIYKD